MVESSDAGALVLPADLEAPLAALETQLAALDAALRQPRDGAVDRVAAQLHEALAQAVQRFQGAAREGGVPAALRHRLALAGAEVAAQREALARATAALDRAIDVLMPPAAAARLYSNAGTSERGVVTGGLTV
ncbi:MAG TPA: hypothetical protein PLZ50_11530 [Rubrivivax sp.]|nr:hypothetical protein [Pseudomonadota bacterium]HPP84172.1 hypothetical protein [Rubrivivax sp.]